VYDILGHRRDYSNVPTSGSRTQHLI
jgi:hypothetical protein